LSIALLFARDYRDRHDILSFHLYDKSDVGQFTRTCCRRTDDLPYNRTLRSFAR